MVTCDFFFSKYGDFCNFFPRRNLGPICTRFTILRKFAKKKTLIIMYIQNKIIVRMFHICNKATHVNGFLQYNQQILEQCCFICVSYFFVLDDNIIPSKIEVLHRALHALGIHHKINNHYIDRLKPKIPNKMQFECRFNLNK